MTLIEKAIEFRRKLQLQLTDLQPERAVILPEAYDPWTPGEYAVGDMRRHVGQVWRCCQAHDSTDNPNWEPGATAAIWVPCHAKDAAYARDYVPPSGAHDAYQAGEYMRWTDGVIYRCLENNTVHDPAALPTAWEAVE